MKVGIIGASGYVGGELLRILSYHPEIEIVVATSEQYKDEYVYRVHPNLRGTTNIKFTSHDENINGKCDIIFTAVPHGSSVKIIPKLIEMGITIIDMAADFRLKNPEDYIKWYNYNHPNPELLDKFTYGLPELHRNELVGSKLIATPGCMALTSILALAPLIKNKIIEKNNIIIDSKIGASGGGVKPSTATHYPERYGVVRPYKPVGHRHIGEIEQELSILSGNQIKISMSPHGVNMVRGILCTIHTFSRNVISTSDIWKIYKTFYENEPFIRLIRDKRSIHKFPDPKILSGSNYCDIGFEKDNNVNRIVLLSATDNLMKGAAGNGVQCMNIAMGFKEETALEFPGLHPV